MVALRPRLLTRGHIEELRVYAQSLWDDAVKLEGLWREGKQGDLGCMSNRMVVVADK